MLQSPKEKKEKKKKNKNKNDTIFLTSTIVYWLLRGPYFEIFGDEKYCLFFSQKVEIWYLLITEKILLWNFWEWETLSFFEAKSWWKDDIYCLLKSSCFKIFGEGKYVLFWDKKLMKIWYLLITEKF